MIRKFFRSMALHYLMVACAGGGALDLADTRESDAGAGLIASTMSAVEHWFDSGLQASATKAGEFCCAWTLQQMPFTFPWSDNAPTR
jgi:hypothetical protein